MRGSVIAGQIVNEYKREQMYKKRKKRVNCKEKKCEYCNFNPICEEREIKIESQEE